jgi:DNA polymerase-1
MEPVDHPGYRLLHEGQIALTYVEAAGMRVDVDYLNRMSKQSKEEIAKLEHRLYETKQWTAWRQRYEDRANLQSDVQLGVVLFEVLKYPVRQEDRTESGERFSTDATILERIKDPFIEDLLKLGKLQKAHGTYLKQIQRELVGDRIHPQFNLHIPVTYRSSSDTPNFQNIPIRDPEVSKLIRTGFIASDDCVLVESDLRGAEVVMATCYHRDPTMITYLKDRTKDMHRDMAAQLYLIPVEWVEEHGKLHRYGAKNKFVFPEFYNSFFMQCAPELWEWADQAKLQAPGGITLRQHLDREFPWGLGDCDTSKDPLPKVIDGTFVAHIQEVEDDFWHRRFKVYGQWKLDWYRLYLEKGYFETLTGFRIAGTMDRNQVINYPIQGSAFHCLLWILIRLVKELRRRKMRSQVVGQIHDSIIADVRQDELSEYLHILQRIAVEDIRKEYTWLVVPLEIENEICPPNGSWYDKKPFDFKGQRFRISPEGEEDSRIFSNQWDFLSYLAAEHRTSHD